MKNAEIALHFDELGDLYELDGAIVHRVVAYRNAAKAVREAPMSVAALAREGRATQLAGIGKTLEEKILALLATGTIPSAERLRAKFPPGLIDMTRPPGLGPKPGRCITEISPTGNSARRRWAAGMSPVSSSARSFSSSVLPIPGSSVTRPARAIAITETGASRTERAAVR